MKYLLVGDIHLSDVPPSVRNYEYTNHIFDKLRCTVDIAEEEQVEGVIWLGDVYHRKQPNRTSHALVQRTIDLIREYKRPVGAVVGNHDMQWDRLDTVDRQPIGVLFRAGLIHVRGGYYGSFELPGVFGIPYLADWKNDLPKYMREWAKSDAQLLVTHAPIFPDGVEPPYDFISASSWAEAMERQGFVAYGHIHEQHGDYKVPAGSHFVNNGAISRGSLHENSLKRKPAVTIYDPDAEQVFRKIELPHLPAEAVFALIQHQQDQLAQGKLDAFVEGVSQISLDSISAEGVMSYLQTIGLRRELIQEIEDILETVTR